MYKEIFTDNVLSANNLAEATRNADKENRFSIKGIPDSRVFFIETGIDVMDKLSSSSDVCKDIAIYEFNTGKPVKESIVIVRYCLCGVSEIFNFTIYIKQ